MGLEEKKKGGLHVSQNIPPAGKQRGILNLELEKRQVTQIPPSIPGKQTRNLNVKLEKRQIPSGIPGKQKRIWNLELEKRQERKLRINQRPVPPGKQQRILNLELEKRQKRKLRINQRPSQRGK